MFEKRLLLVDKIWLLKDPARRGSIRNKGTTLQGRVRSWYSRKFKSHE